MHTSTDEQPVPSPGSKTKPKGNKATMQWLMLGGSSVEKPPSRRNGLTNKGCCASILPLCPQKTEPFLPASSFAADREPQVTSSSRSSQRSPLQNQATAGSWCKGPHENERIYGLSIVSIGKRPTRSLGKRSVRFLLSPC